MKIEKDKTGEQLTVRMIGRLDTKTAPQLEQVFDAELFGVHDLQLDLKELEYISSAGLRVLLKAAKAMKELGKMEIRNVNEEVMEVFTITGFSDILTIV